MEIKRTDLQLLDQGITSAVRVFVQALGMFSENITRYGNNEEIAYNEQDFQNLIDENRLHLDDVAKKWQL